MIIILLLLRYRSTLYTKWFMDFQCTKHHIDKVAVAMLCIKLIQNSKTNAKAASEIDLNNIMNTSLCYKYTNTISFHITAHAIQLAPFTTVPFIFYQFLQRTNNSHLSIKSVVTSVLLPFRTFTTSPAFLSTNH